LEYTPYGETWIEWKNPGLRLEEAAMPYRFTGKELDAETGLYYYGARYLDPKTSRWLSADPAMGDYLPGAPVDDAARQRNGALPGQGGVFNLVNLHVYHYAGNNPIRYIDPDGREDSEPVRAIFYYDNSFSDPDQSFRKAAETLAQGYNETVYMIAVRTEADFKEKWNSLSSTMTANSTQIASLDIVTHGDSQNLFFVGGPSNDGSLSTSEVADLTKLNYSSGGEINLYSCNSGTLSNSGIGQVFADTQGVTVSGQYGRSSFSENQKYYSRISSTSNSVYLRAFDRGLNNPWGKGGAYPPRKYNPAARQ
jgi:RHS repeat-associated protein